MSSPDLHRQAAQLRATADRIDRERGIRWHALLFRVADVTERDRQDRDTVQRLQREAAQIERDAADIRREERMVA